MIIKYIAALWRWFGRQGYPCLFRFLTGLYCPGCGGTRALKYLLRGQVLTSVYYHPLVLYIAVTGVMEGGLWAVDRVKGAGGWKTETHGSRVVENQDEIECKAEENRGENEGRNKGSDCCRRRRPYEKEVYVGLGIIVLNWAVKNWILVVNGTAMIP